MCWGGAGTKQMHTTSDRLLSDWAGPGWEGCCRTAASASEAAEGWFATVGSKDSLMAAVWDLGSGSQGGVILESSPEYHYLQGSRQRGQAAL